MARRLEPRESRGQLEQQPEELPVGESQQEYAGQSQQQPRLPRGHSSTDDWETYPPNRVKSCPEWNGITVSFRANPIGPVGLVAEIRERPPALFSVVLTGNQVE